MSILNKLTSLLDSKENHFETLYQRGEPLFRDDYFKEVHSYCIEDMKGYYFEANPSFLYEYRDMFDLGRYPVVMLRDGFWGILDFFFLHKKPINDFNSIVLINKKFEKLIPKSWKHQVAVYEILPKSNQLLTNELVIYGSLHSEYFWNKSVESFFLDQKEKIELFDKISCVFDSHGHTLSDNPFQREHLYDDLVKNMNHNLSSNISFLPKLALYKEIKKVQSFSFYNLDESKCFIADSFIDHYFYSRGCTNYNVMPSQSETDGSYLDYDLSMYHKVRISEVDIKNSAFEEFYFHYRLEGNQETDIYKIAQTAGFKELYQRYF